MLADVFEKFRNNSLKNYGLGQSHYLSIPALSWDTLFNITKVELELIPDPNKFIFFEIGIRVQISYNSNRYSKASNKFLKSYDPKPESKLIIDLDANNLYDYAISKFIPIK